MFLIRLYQVFVSPLTHFFGVSTHGPSFSCRFSPTCSQYLSDATAKYGIIRGGYLGLKRFLRCHPWSSHDIFDPVP